jgi:hypothetical protein
MNTAQRKRIIQKIAGLAYGKNNDAYFAWLEYRSVKSGTVSADSIKPETIDEGEGIFWQCDNLKGVVYLMSPVKVLDALEAVQ